MLDLSFGNNLNIVEKVEVEQHLWTSDHSIVYARGFCENEFEIVE